MTPHEDVFDEPFTFAVGGDPNPHVAFGWGVHFGRKHLRVTTCPVRPVVEQRT